MSREAKNKVVPRLRFPQFKNAAEWTLKLVEEYFYVGSSKRVLEEDWTDKGVPFYRTRELVSLSKNEPLRNEIFISNELFEELKNKYGVPNDGDFLVSGVGTLGICYQVRKDDRFYFKDGNVLWFKQKEGINSNYFKYSFQSDFIQKQILGQASISTVGTYTIQNAKTTEFYYPPAISEQQKIADCLSSLDDYISAESKKLDALRDHKKGLMQQLFPAEGETVPRLRFKEFEGSGEWEEKNFGKMGDFTGGGTPSKSNQSFWEGSIPWVSSSDIDEESINQIKISRFITEEALNDSATKIVPPNSILLVSRVGVGKLAVTRDSICTSQDFTNFTPYVDDIYFLAYLLKNQNETLLGFSQGMAIKGFTKDDISKLKVLIPGKDEQKKIANCLSFIDELIEAQIEKVEELKMHKKGLMQGLFPNVEKAAYA